MYFGNSEKKIEIALRHGAKSLKVLPKNFWEELVEKVGARILSSVSSPLCDSYLLSESSLFVFPQKLLMVTSSPNSLLPVIQNLLQHFKLEELDSLFYEVKNAPLSSVPSKSFFQDSVALSALMPGAALCLNAETPQPLYLFHLDRPSQHLKNSDATLEVLLYELDAQITNIFAQEKSRARKWISENASFRDFFESFDIQDYSFQPYGYSLNAIKGDKYFTFHISPRDRGAFASFETNCFDREADELVQAVHALFRPKSFQVLSFAPEKSFAFPFLQKFPLLARSEKKLSNGFALQFFHATESTALDSVEELNLPAYVAPVLPLPPAPVPEEKIEVEVQALPASDPLEGWLLEKGEELLLGTRIKEKLFHEKSERQDIQIVDTQLWGKVLLCDGLLVCAEKDEAIYHEMLAHVPLFVHHNPNRVLILGGADLGTAREVLKHPSVQECLCVESDGVLIEAAKKFFPWAAKVFADERFKLEVQDLQKFVADGAQQYDLILVENARKFFQSEEALAALKNILAPGGILLGPAESPHYAPAAQLQIKDSLAKSFAKVFFYNYSNLIYPGALGSFVFASDNYHPLEDFDREKAQKSNLDLQYYNAEIHFGSFFLPTFMRKNLTRKVVESSAEPKKSADLSV